jgi:8-oxo-dGTP pyrophosphatase MutT (NUDIX family)
MSPDTPHGAAAIITDRRGRVLMHLRDDTPGVAWPGYWAVPAAASEPGEDEHDTMARELREDAGLAVAHLARLFEIQDTHGPGRRLTVFAADQGRQTPVLPPRAPARPPDPAVRARRDHPRPADGSGPVGRRGRADRRTLDLGGVVLGAVIHLVAHCAVVHRVG